MSVMRPEAISEVRIESMMPRQRRIVAMYVVPIRELPVIHTARRPVLLSAMNRVVESPYDVPQRVELIIDGHDSDFSP